MEKSFRIDASTVRVDIVPDAVGCLYVNVIALDSVPAVRKQVHSWGVSRRPEFGTPMTAAESSRGMKLALRLKRAVLAGVAFDLATIKTDIYGNTYVSAPAVFLGRTLNAGLKARGF